MVNVIAPFGFASFGRLEGGAPTAGLTRVFIASSDANAYFRGDPVVTSTAQNQFITQPSSGTVQIRGIFQGCEFFQGSVGRTIWFNSFPGGVTGSTADVIAYVIDDPDQKFIVQTSSVGAVTSSMIGNNIGFSLASGAIQGSSQGNTTTGLSVVSLASTSAATTNTLPFRVLDFYSNSAPPGVNGTDNTTGGNIVIVYPNNWDRKQLTGV